MLSESEAGFTLIEALVALFIVGLSAAITLPVIADVMRRDAEVRLDQQLGDEALSLLAMAEQGVFPGSVDADFQDWYLTRQDLQSIGESTFSLNAYWLEAEHKPSQKRFRVLIVS